MTYKITEIPYSLDDERLFVLRDPDPDWRDPNTGDRSIVLTVLYNRTGQEYEGIIGLRVIGQDLDIQDPHDLIAEVIKTLEEDKQKYIEKDQRVKIETVRVFHCDRCNKIKDFRSDLTTGYGQTESGDKHCWDCCADLDRERMIKDGQIVLYLTMKDKKVKTPNTLGLPKTGSYMTPDKITNWPGSLSFDLLSWSKGHHNWGLDRFDVWFKGPDDLVWYGRHQGHNTQLIHCKRTKHTGYAGVVADYHGLTLESQTKE